MGIYDLLKVTRDSQNGKYFIVVNSFIQKQVLLHSRKRPGR